MALKVIGAGLGRTGTKSLQTALNMLGFGPCHHMVEVFRTAHTIPLWIAAGEGQADWDAIFADYQSAVDYPTAGHWRAIAAHYPDAKVILSTRDPETWFESTQATIFAPGRDPDPNFARFRKSFLGAIDDKVNDRAAMVAHFKAHEAAVRAEIAPDRLLVYRAGDGWGPLCAFLGAPAPDAPYPSENDRASFAAMVAAANARPPSANA